MSNQNKIKITHSRSGRSFFKTPEEAESIMSNPNFKGSYTSEKLAAEPKELSETAAQKKLRIEAEKNAVADADNTSDETIK